MVEHAEHEENEEFSKLQRNLDKEDLRRMATAVQAAEGVAAARKVLLADPSTRP